MDPLLDELTSSGVLDAATLDWAKAHHGERGGSLDSTLLELDLIDEEGLLRGLEACYGLIAARPEDLELATPELSKSLPQSFSTSFQMCPLQLSGSELLALVESPLPDEWLQELRDLFGLEVRQMIASSHHIALARAAVYGIPLDPRARELEIKLARRRGVADARQVLDRLAASNTLDQAVDSVLDFAASLMDFCCLLIYRDEQLHVAAVRGRALPAGARLPMPGAACTLGTAIRHGGYFVGQLAGSDANQTFFQALGRDLPRWAFVAPVPTGSQSKVLFCADNGSRGMATRWIAELSLLVSRLGQRGGEWDSLTDQPAPTQRAELDRDGGERADTEESEPPGAWAPVRDADRGQVVLTAAEEAALDRLRQAASEAELPLELFVDELLRIRAEGASGGGSSAALVSEVKGLFEKLATDIPTQLARGMETAFRDMVPRLSPGAAPAAAAAPARSSSPASAGVTLVTKDTAPREVQSYRSRRKKSKRVKL